MKRRLISMLYVLKEHIMYIVLSFILIFIMSNLLKKCLYVISIVTAFMYITSIYSLGWNSSNKAYKAYTSPGNAHKKDTIRYSIYDGFINPIPLLVIGIAVFVLSIIKSLIWPFNIYNLAFGFIVRNGNGDMIIPFAIIATFLPYITYSLGYILGKDGKIFFIKYLPKVVYKKK